MAESNPQRSSPHLSRRRPQVKLTKRNRFARVIGAFNRALNDSFPLTPYRDVLGRSRTAGAARRARAAAVLQALARAQATARSGIVYLGYEGLGRACHRSRSTAYRAVTDLVAARLLGRDSGGGKTHDEQGRLVERANAYTVPDELLGPEQPRGWRPKPKTVEQPVVGESLGQRLAQERLERWRSGEIRAGP